MSVAVQRNKQSSLTSGCTDEWQLTLFLADDHLVSLIMVGIGGLTVIDAVFLTPNPGSLPTYLCAPHLGSFSQTAAYIITTFRLALYGGGRE
jgi:hypothetical protein